MGVTTAAAPAVLMAHCGTKKINREELAKIPAPAATDTHKPVAHIALVHKLIESLAYRHLEVVRDEYAVSPDGMKVFGVLDLSHQTDDYRFSIGLRNSNDKSMRIALTAGLRVFVCDNMAFSGEFQPLMAKHSKHLPLEDVVTLGVDKIQRAFTPLSEQVLRWKQQSVSEAAAKLCIYDAFLKKRVAPRQLMPAVHKAYFEPEHQEFAAATAWSLYNAFTHAFKELNPIRQFQATAQLGTFFPRWN